MAVARLFIRYNKIMSQTSNATFLQIISDASELSLLRTFRILFNKRSESVRVAQRRRRLNETFSHAPTAYPRRYLTDIRSQISMPR